jgi:probable H4MPT-linked C1 transfer pathway protein
MLGLDIGGANLKAATSQGQALSLPFPLWREPSALPARLRELLSRFPPHRLAVTMTGELCDCFASKRDGVHAILTSVEQAAPDTPIQVWSTHGRFLTLAEARADPWRVAAANWHALATFAGRFAPDGAALLLDIGSTTADIIPLWQGRPRPRAWTDPERLASAELVYTGVRRTPLCAVLGFDVAAELFATMHDVYLLLEIMPEEPENRDTGDGRPATRAGAHGRLARMMCSDAEAFSRPQAVALAQRAHDVQVRYLVGRIRRVAATLPEPPRLTILSGSGEFLARAAAQRAELGAARISLAEMLSPAVSQAACAYALAVLDV